VRGATHPVDAQVGLLNVLGKQGLDLEPGVLQVEVPLDAVHHLVADLALVAKQHDLAALGLQQLADQPLVGQRAILGPVVVQLAAAGFQPPAAELVQPPHPLDGVVARPLLAGELLQPDQRRIGGAQAPAQLLLGLAVVAV
jgi:hypothetical protein